MGIYTANAKRTKKAIAEAYIGLLEKKTFEKITVQNILTNAEINRSTFYKYFLDKYDLTRQILGGLIDGYADIINENKKNPPSVTFGSAYRYIEENKRTFRALFTVKTRELDTFTEIIDGLYTIHRNFKLTNGKYADIEAYYFADLHYVPLYFLLIYEDYPPPANRSI